MKILFISRLYLPHLGGVEIHLRELATILTKAGHSVSILTYQNDKKLSLQKEDGGIQIFRIPFEVHSSEDKHENLLKSKLTTKLNLWNEIIKYKKLFIEADVVHVHDVFWWTLPIYTLIRNKVFITFHGWETKYPVSLNVKLHRYLASKLSKGTIHVGDFIKYFYWDKPDFVTYGGINSMRFTKTYAKSQNIEDDNSLDFPIKFVFIGRLDQDTDVHLYIEFLKLLKVRKIKFEIVWVGDGSLKNECQKLGEVTGFIKNISKHIATSDFVFASSYLSILEAQCLGKIVFCLYSNPLKKVYLETFPGSKFMFVAGNVESMLQKLRHISSSSKLRSVLEQDARQFAQNQTWNKVANLYMKLWQKIN